MNVRTSIALSVTLCSAPFGGDGSVGKVDVPSPSILTVRTGTFANILLPGTVISIQFESVTCLKRLVKETVTEEESVLSSPVSNK
jgi:hypothetical protein